MSEFFIAFIWLDIFIRFYFPAVLLFDTLFSVQIDCIVNQFYLFRDDKAKLGPYLATFFQVVNDAQQVQLDIHFGFTAQGESVQTHDPADVDKGVQQWLLAVCRGRAY